MPNLGQGNTPNLYVTPPVNLFEGEKNIVCKRENLHTSMVFGTHTLMFKLDSDLELKLPHIKLQ